MYKVLKKYLPPFYFLMLIANTTILAEGFLYLFITILLVGYIFLKGKKIPILVIGLSLSWFLINVIAVLFTGLSVKWLYVFRMVFVYFIGPYVFLTAFGVRLIYRMLDLIYYLTILSIVLFALNYFFLDLFNSLESVFKPFTRDILAESPFYWSVGFYTNAILAPEGLRNSGFMWEPGYFALMCVFGIIMHWLKNGMSFDKKFFIYSIAIITTLSTAGYLSLFILFIAKFQKNISPVTVILSSTIIIIFISYVYTLPFISEKIDLYFDIVEKNEFNYLEQYGAIKLNRFQIFLYDMKRIAYNPFGYGTLDRFGLDGVSVVGINGVSGVFRVWGVFLGSYFFYHIYQFIIKFNSFNNNKRAILLMFLSFLILLFSNPIDTNVFFYLIITTSIVYNKLKI